MDDTLIPYTTRHECSVTFQARTQTIYDPTPPRQDMNETDLSVDESVTDPTRCDMKVSVTDMNE